MSTCIATHCLDRLDSLKDQGVTGEVVRNVAGLVYIGESESLRGHVNFSLTQYLGMADTVRTCKLF